MPGARTYLDHLASAPLAASARAAMDEVAALPGHPSSAHAEGRRVREALEAARSRVATTLGCRPREVVFTASGTVASQLALRGAARARRERSRRVVLSAIEHPAVLEAGEGLEREGFDVVRVPPAPDGTVDPERFLAAVGADAAVAALMFANHETGVCMPVPPVAEALTARGIPLVCDACLGPGRIDVGVDRLAADLIVFSGHKFGGPRGTGLLYVRRKTKVDALWAGGLQEERLHPGVENVAGAVGASVALAEAQAARASRAAGAEEHLRAFLAAIGDLDDWHVVGEDQTRLPGVATLEVGGVEGEATMINLDLEGIAVSTGSACALGGADPSPTLLAMGFTRRRAASTLRFSFDDTLDASDVARAADVFVRVVSRLRALARP